MSEQPRPGDIVRIGVERTRWRVVRIHGLDAVLKSVEVEAAIPRRCPVSTLRVVEPHPGGPR